MNSPALKTPKRTAALPAAPAFSARLYLDTLRRLRLTGVTLALITLLYLLSALLPLLAVGQYHSIDSALNPRAFSTPLSALALFGPVLLMVQGFFFLYQRKGSDFYHSLPYTRLCLGISVTLAALTWFFLALGLGVATCAVIIPQTGALFPMALQGWMLATYSAVGLLVAGCALIALSLSGTPLAGLLIGGLTLFLPRFALTLYRTFVVYASDMMIYNDAGTFLSPAFHLPTALLVLFTRSDELQRTAGVTHAQLFANGPAILYTLGLALLALVWGMRCFIRRKSELAGQDLARPISRYALRAAAMSPVLLYGAYLTYRYRYDLRMIVVAAALVGAGYLAFTRIRTKSWRMTCFAAAGMVLAGTLTLALCFGGLAAGKHTRTVHPKAQDIAAVTFPDQAGNYTPLADFNYGYNLDSVLTGDVRYTQPELRELSSRALADTADVFDAYDQGDTDTTLPYRRVTLHLELTDGSVVRRTVRFRDEQYELLHRQILSTPAFMEALRYLPKETPLALYALDADITEKQLPAELDGALRANMAAQSDSEFLGNTQFSSFAPADLYVRDESAMLDVRLVQMYWDGVDLVTRVISVTPLLPDVDSICYGMLAERFGPAFQENLKAMRPYLSDPAVGNAIPLEEPLPSYSITFISPPGVTRVPEAYTSNLGGLQPWVRRYNVYDQNAQSEEAYEGTRADEGTKVLDIFTRGEAALHGGKNVIQVALSVPTVVDASRGLYDYYSTKVYLQVTAEDVVTLQTIYDQRNASGIGTW